MRNLAKNEQRLLILFGAAVFVALNLFAIRAWMQNRGTLLAEIDKTRSAISTGTSWITAAASSTSTAKTAKTTTLATVTTKTAAAATATATANAA